MAKRTLLVEGTDDEHVVKHVCGNRGIPRLDEIKPHGGVTELLGAVPVRLKASEEGDVIGVILDADTDIAARWESLRDRLSAVGYGGVPQQPSADGTIVDPPEGTLLPRVGLWIMPNNRTNGTLEDFLRFLIPTESDLFVHVERSVETIPEGERRFKEIDAPKALIHTWLAWQEKPGKPMGTSITARYLDANVLR